MCGILGLVCFSIFTGIPAIILGHLSRSSIRQSMGRLTGSGMALTGLIMGYVSVALVPIVLIIVAIMVPGMLRSRQLANESAAVANLRTIDAAEVNYFAGDGAGKYGDIDALVGARLIDNSFNRTKSGYQYAISADSSGYTATANPVTPNVARYGFRATKDGTVRYSIDPTLAPPGLSGMPVP